MQADRQYIPCHLGLSLLPSRSALTSPLETRDRKPKSDVISNANQRLCLVFPRVLFAADPRLSVRTRRDVDTGEDPVVLADLLAAEVHQRFEVLGIRQSSISHELSLRYWLDFEGWHARQVRTASVTTFF